MYICHGMDHIPCMTVQDMQVCKMQNVWDHKMCEVSKNAKCVTMQSV
jgi:hypothetical protein